MVMSYPNFVYQDVPYALDFSFGEVIRPGFTQIFSSAVNDFDHCNASTPFYQTCARQDDGLR